MKLRQIAVCIGSRCLKMMGKKAIIELKVIGLLGKVKSQKCLYFNRHFNFSHLSLYFGFIYAFLYTLRFIISCLLFCGFGLVHNFVPSSSYCMLICARGALLVRSIRCVVVFVLSNMEIQQNSKNILMRIFFCFSFCSFSLISLNGCLFFIEWLSFETGSIESASTEFNRINIKRFVTTRNFLFFFEC